MDSFRQTADTRGPSELQARPLCGFLPPQRRPGVTTAQHTPMDIYILRDGKEIGPFSEETTKTLLQQGSIHGNDFAWHPGLPKWLPLATVLMPAPPIHDTPPPPPPPTEPRVELPTFASTSLAPTGVEPATEKQKALLTYLGIPFTAVITKDQAALLINETIEDPRQAGLLTKWNTDRLKIRPDLFAAEIQEQKEARAGEYFEICQTEGAEYFTKVTKAHCQVLVGFLDGKFPHWNEDPATAARKYFFPAVAEKFPQLVAAAWKGKLHYDTGAKTAADPGPKRPATGKLRQKNASSQVRLATIARGFVFAAIFLAMFFFVKMVIAPDEKKPATPPPQTGSGPLEKTVLPPVEPPAPAPAPLAPAADPVAVVDPVAPPEPAEPPKNPDPKMETPPAPPKPADPLPGFPPDPLAPAPAPTTPPPTDPLAPAPPPTPPTDPLAPAPPVVPPATPANPGANPKSVLKLTKPVEVQLAYGKMKLPAGTNVKFVSQEGNLVRVAYLGTMLTIPASSTDIGVPEAPPPVPPASGPDPAVPMTKPPTNDL